ncbi:MAG: NAD(+) synthase [Prevotellaceae bacterium]|nr:NAD(+) synthase [Candidatus Colivivens caballi]
MNRFGYVRVATAIPQVKVADCTFNVQQIESLIAQAEGRGVSIICFPELCITSATAGDLMYQELLITGSENALFKLLDFTRSLNIVSIVGMPVRIGALLIDSAVVVQGGKIHAVIPNKPLGNCATMLCGNTVSVSQDTLIRTNETYIGITIGDDITQPKPQCGCLCQAGAEIIFNLASAKELIGTHRNIHRQMSVASSQCNCAYVLSSCGYGESTADAVYAGHALIYEDGELLAENERFSTKEQLIISDVDIELLRHRRQEKTTFMPTTSNIITISSHSLTLESEEPTLHPIRKNPFISNRHMDERYSDILAIQTAGLAKRLTHTGAKTLVVGISGGLDSTLALLVCAKTIDMLHRGRKDIIAITMPGFGTSDRTYTNALTLMESLGVTQREISIKEACLLHLSDICHSTDNHDVTYENSQARERTQILMDIANDTGGLVVGTGDLSELALGWCTFNGDQMSNYAVNCSIPKTLMQHIVRWIAKNTEDKTISDTLLDIVDTPISPELTPADDEGKIQQKTENLVGPYELHDFFLYHTIRNGFRPAKILFIAKQAFKGEYTEEELIHWLTTFCRRFITQQFKRSCSPDGPQVGSVTLIPTQWHMPSDASSSEWLNNIVQ